MEGPAGFRARVGFAGAPGISPAMAEGARPKDRAPLCIFGIRGPGGFWRGGWEGNPTAISCHRRAADAMGGA